MPAHACEPPLDPRRLGEAMTWACPECGEGWQIEFMSPLHPDPELEITHDRGVTPARWVRRQ